MGIPIPKTLVIWAPPSHITLAIWVRVRVKVKGMPISLARVFGMGMPKTQGCPYHCDSGTHFGSSSLSVSKMTNGSEI